ncbi:ribonuclease H-like domain-containing protein [Tanacetum coccineum]
MNNGRGGCSYKEFMDCSPKDYDGKGGAMVYTRWIDKMESVQDMSGCGENQKEKNGDIDINTLFIKQYMALTRRDRPGVVIPELGNDVDFEIKSHFMSELRCNLFAGADDEDAHEHVRRVLEITDLFHIPGVTGDAITLIVFPITLTRAARRWKNMLPAWLITTWDLLEKAFIRKYCPPLKTAKKLEEIQNFKQRIDESLYQAWERYNDLLFRCPQHDLNNHQKVHIFYKEASREYSCYIGRLQDLRRGASNQRASSQKRWQDRRSKVGTVTPFANPDKQFRARKEVSPAPIHNIYTFYESESSESDTENVDIENLTLEQYLALDQNNTRRRFTCLDDSTFEIKGQLLRELSNSSFSGGPTDSVVEHISNVLEIASIFNAQESTFVQCIFRHTRKGNCLRDGSKDINRNVQRAE